MPIFAERWFYPVSLYLIARNVSKVASWVEEKEKIILEKESEMKINKNVNMNTYKQTRQLM